jgi:crossover junction endodeoxyribonuclease RuvC
MIKPSLPKVCLGIDPGYDRVGWAVGEIKGSQLQPIAYGLIQTDKHQTHFVRYQQVEAELSAILNQYQPVEAAIETLFFSNNQTTAMKVSEIRGIIISTLLRSKVECFEYNPSQIKLTVTGFGKADKKAVEKMIRLQLKLPAEKVIDDTLDALAILLTHSTQLRKLT